LRSPLTHARHGPRRRDTAFEERRAFYELCWHLGGSQTDMALLCAENIDWNQRLITYRRKKNGELAQIHFGPEVEQVLRALPQSGPLFPYLRTVRCCDRGTEFKQRCQGLGIEGVTLHCHRYAWAQRAKACGYPERYAHRAVGGLEVVTLHRAGRGGGWQLHQHRRGAQACGKPPRTKPSRVHPHTHKMSFVHELIPIPEAGKTR
jgi:hypothetical protein